MVLQRKVDVAQATESTDLIIRNCYVYRQLKGTVLGRRIDELWDENSRGEVGAAARRGIWAHSVSAWEKSRVKAVAVSEGGCSQTSLRGLKAQCECQVREMWRKWARSFSGKGGVAGPRAT